MTATTLALTAADPEITTRLAEAALVAYRRAAVDRSADLEALAGLAGQPLDGELRLWAELIATADGFPLIGTGLMAPIYPALLWNGSRLRGAAPDLDGAPLLAALAAADPGDTGGLDRIFCALAAADAVRHGARRLLGADPAPVALPTLETMAAATAALLAGPGEDADLVRVLDRAASLMVLTPGDARSAAAGLWAGHGAASGWLAARLSAQAATPMAGSVAHTLSAAAGRAVRDETSLGSVAAVLAGLR